MGVESEAKIRLARPVLQVVLGLEARAREVGDLVLLNTDEVEPLARERVELGGEVIVRDVVGMIADAAGDQFPAQARVFVNLKHVDAKVRNSGGNRYVKRLAPTSGSLMRETCDEIDVDIVNARAAQALNIGEHDFAIMQPADGASFSFNQRLHAQAKAIHAAAQQRIEDFWR